MSRLDQRWLALKRGVEGVEYTPAPELAAEVEAIYKDKAQRYLVEAALLASPDVEVISKFLEVPAAVLYLYRELCFDIEGLTKLQRMAYIQGLKNAEERNMKIWAATQGVRFLQWRFGDDVKISPVEGMQAMFSDAYYKSKEAFFSGNSTEASKEALKWMKQAVDISKQLKSWTTDADEARKDIEIALQSFTGDDIEFATLDDLKE